MLNATVIYNSIPTNKHVSNLDFRLQVIDGLLTGWERNTMLRFTRSNANNLPVRLMEKCIILAKTLPEENVTALFVATGDYTIENKRG